MILTLLGYVRCVRRDDRASEKIARARRNFGVSSREFEMATSEARPALSRFERALANVEPGYREFVLAQERDALARRNLRKVFRQIDRETRA